MARFDVFPNPEGPGYLLDVQSDLLDGLNTRVVAPLMPRAHAPEPAKRLNPEFEVEGAAVVMVTQFIAAVPAAILGQPVARLDTASDTITNALDMLTQGF
ncbi:CcdB family protein [Thalassorhabdomicrobium marinisediminis]|uniref:Toxin CcdB n=1 Tax=Thalassorhabdomicrobium marinisediminis TaxID=2170577 RepID=A0A2T7FTQ8_9RHOB|nr:CcdB family protein [Thalassorhabdomicrobium marinisediminis]PVA05559.1 plasmid maintenance protein CcdB [Thalassorhabdomicrobium marinisediminis]